MLDPIALGALAGVGGYKLLRHWLAGRQESSAPAVPPPPPLVRPKPVNTPHFDVLRRAQVTDLASLEEYLRQRVVTSARSELSYWFGNVLWPFLAYANRVHLFLGAPGVGKTTLIRLAMLHYAELFQKVMCRWFVVDPDGAYLPWLFRILPPGVPLLILSPQHPLGRRWLMWQDVQDQMTIHLVAAAIVNERLMDKGKDPFWYSMVREVVINVLTLFVELGGRFEFTDLCVLMKYRPLLRPLLAQSPKTRAFAARDLKARLGNEIGVTARQVFGPLMACAAMMRHAREGFTLKDIMDGRLVAYLGMHPAVLDAVGAYANVLVYLLSKKLLARRDERNHTAIWFDELHYGKDIMGLDEIAAFGRGSGVGLFLGTQSYSGLERKFGAERTKDLFELLSSVMMFSAGYPSAKAFCDLVGEWEGVKQSWSDGQNHTKTYTEGESSQGWSRSWAEAVGYQSGNSWSIERRPAVLTSEITNLPDCDYENDRVSFMLFNRNTGACRVETPFRKMLDRTPALHLPVDPLAVRPAAEQELLPWGMSDLRRLNVALTPALAKALNQVWGDERWVAL